MLPATLLLKLPPGTDVLVTRKNPVHWHSADTPADRYFMSPQELLAGYQYGDFGKHVILRNQNGLVLFGGSALHLLLDDPQRALTGGADTYSHAVQRLTAAANASGLMMHITKRQCRPHCRCLSGHKLSYETAGVDF